MYRFEDFELDPSRHVLARGGSAVRVERQVFQVLLHLIEHRSRLVTKAELLDAVWGDRFVSESALTSRLKAARRAVGDNGQQQRVIATVHGVGYRFVAPVQVEGEEQTDDSEPPVRRPQEIRYCVSPDGVRIAYALSGDGPPWSRRPTG